MLMLMIYWAEEYLLRKKNKEALVIASKEIDLEENAEKLSIRSCLEIRMQLRNNNVKIGNKSFDNAEKLRYLQTTLTNENSIHEESKSKLNSENRAILRCRIFCFPVFCSKT
jgi:hypothetical protein